MFQPHRCLGQRHGRSRSDGNGRCGGLSRRRRFSRNGSRSRAQSDPEGLWAEEANAIDWTRRWDKVLDAATPPFYRWFAGAELNTCYNALDRHVERGRAEQTALIYESPVTDSKKSFTYRALRDLVAKLAGAIAATGVGKGDRVIIYMPMIPEAVMAMLACARLGAVPSVGFGGFPPTELPPPLHHCSPQLALPP